MGVPTASTWSQLYNRKLHPIYIVVVGLFLIGVLFGIVMVNALSLEQQAQFSQLLGDFFVTVGLGETSLSYWQLFSKYLKWVALIWLLGLSVIGLPIIIIIDFLKGVFVGFTVGYLISIYSWKGLLLVLSAVMPQNAIVIPAMIICSVLAVAFSLTLIRHGFIQSKGTMVQPFARYTLVFFGFIVLLAIVSLYEFAVYPHLMHRVIPLVLDP
jgi:stage II sporulation protein M